MFILISPDDVNFIAFSNNISKICAKAYSSLKVFLFSTSLFKVNSKPLFSISFLCVSITYSTIFKKLKVLKENIPDNNAKFYVSFQFYSFSENIDYLLNIWAFRTLRLFKNTYETIEKENPDFIFIHNDDRILVF